MLKDISKIVSGHNFRSSIKNEKNGDIFVIQGKDIIKNKDITEVKNLTTISSQAPLSPYFLQNNDILLVSRGLDVGTFRSALFTITNKKVIASSSVLIIRITDALVIPKYILLYLNSFIGQKKLLQIVSGSSYVRTILIKNLDNLEIPIPSIHKQKLLINLYNNILKQEQIINRKREINQKIIKETFNNL